MNRLKLIRYVRSMTRDFTEAIFREDDIVTFINEGIDRIRQVIPELRNLKHLDSNSKEPTLIPEQYRHLLGIYATSRCSGQDERNYQATTYMNEFEVKLEELRIAIENGEINIVDENGEEISADTSIDYVDLEPYWGLTYSDQEERLEENEEED